VEVDGKFSSSLVGSRCRGGSSRRTVKHVTIAGELSGLEDVEGTRISPSRSPKSMGAGDVQECGGQGKAGVEGMVFWMVVLVPLLEIRQSRASKQASKPGVELRTEWLRRIGQIIHATVSER
jgi:hypothetical protein